MIEQITKKLAQTLSERRFRHSTGVAQTAQHLAQRFGCDERKAFLAGLLHDCARDLSSNCLLAAGQAFGIVMGELEYQHPVLLHAPVGARLAQDEYGVADDDIQQAIALHTTGAPGMTVLAKIIFLADMIEPGRSFTGVERIRLLAMEDLDRAVLAAYNHSLIFLTGANTLIHPNTVLGRNELILKIHNL